MTRLSNNPESIRNQIEQSNAVLEQFKTQLEQVPLEDPNERTSLEREIRMEKGRRSKLERHLKGLEDEFDGLLENTPSPTLQYDEF